MVPLLQCQRCLIPKCARSSCALSSPVLEHGCLALSIQVLAGFDESRVFRARMGPLSEHTLHLSPAPLAGTELHVCMCAAVTQARVSCTNAKNIKRQLF